MRSRSQPKILIFDHVGLRASISSKIEEKNYYPSSEPKNLILVESDFSSKSLYYLEMLCLNGKRENREEILKQHRK